MPKTRLSYPEEFRREAAELVRQGRSVQDVADSLGVTHRSLRTWVKRDQLERREGVTLAERQGLHDLRCKVKRLEQERDLPQASRGLFVRESVNKYRRE